ncbi:unnamed protein product, partial [Polarella glacialis]
AYVRGHEMPAFLQNEKSFRFGQKTAASTHMSHQTGKDAIAPPPAEGAEDPQAHERYVRSHQAFAPGERVNRRYAWPTEILAQPEKHAFGLSLSAGPGVAQDGRGVREALTSFDCSPDEEGRTRIVTRLGEDFRRATFGPIGGRPAGRYQVSADMTFGTPSSKSSTVSAGQLIRGCYTAEEQLPDRDLGRCLREGRRNIDTDRVFGQATRPLSRTDSFVGAAFSPWPRGQGGDAGQHQSRMRFDDEESQSGIGDVIAPKGACKREFAQPRSKGEAQSLLQAAGCELGPAEFDGLWGSVADKAGVFSSTSGTVEVPLEAMVKAFAASCAASKFQATSPLKDV